MKRNQRRIAWGTLLVLLLGYGGVLQLRPVWAGGPLELESPGVAYTWGGNPPTAAITPDTGALGILDPTTALSNLLIAAAAWEDIPSSSITLTNAGPDSVMGPEGSGDFAVSNFMNFVGSPCAVPGISPMIFDNEDTDANGHGDIFDEMGIPVGVLGVAGPSCVLGSTIVKGFAIFNGPAVDPDDTTGENFRGVMTHEFGHFLNFGHSVVNGQAFLFRASDALFPDGSPLRPQAVDIETMFPISVAPKEMATLHQDDIAIASTLYPDPNMPLSDFGAITGRLLDVSSPRTGGQIIARNIANPLQGAVSAISGDFLQADTPGHPLRGTFTLNMLTPGAMYSLEVRDTVDKSFSTPVFLAPGGSATGGPMEISLGPLPGPEEFYSGPNESTSDDPTAAPFLITVPSGGPHSPVVADILLNGIPTILLANFVNGNTDAFNSRIYLSNSSATPGSVAVRVFALPLLAGTARELTITPLSLGILGAKSAFNLKLAEDILVPLGIALPYTTDGGNLTLEFTIGSNNVRGMTQVFSGDFAFGTYPLQEIP